MSTSGKRGKPWGTPALQAEIAKAIALHRRQYGNKHYDLVRERAEYAPWIGKEAGATGTQRFKRLVRRVRQPLPSDRTRPHQNRETNAEQQAWAEVETQRANAQCSLPIQLSPEQVMSGGGTALIGFLALQDLIVDGPTDLQRAREALLVDDPAGIGGKRTFAPELLQKNVLATVNFAKGVADLVRDYASIFPTRDFAVGLMRIALEAAGDNKDAQLRVTQQVGQLIQQLNGLGPGAPE